MKKWFDDKSEKYRYKEGEKRKIEESIKDAEKFPMYSSGGRFKIFIKKYWFWIICLILIVIVLYYLLK